MSGEQRPPPAPSENRPAAEIIALQRHPLWLRPPAPQKTPAAPAPAVRFRQLEEQMERLEQDLRGLRQHYARALSALAALARRTGREPSFETLAAAVDVSFNAILRLCAEVTDGGPPEDPRRGGAA